MVATAFILEPGGKTKISQQLIDTVECTFGSRARDVQVDMKGLQILTMMVLLFNQS